MKILKKNQLLNANFVEKFSIKIVDLGHILKLFMKILELNVKHVVNFVENMNLKDTLEMNMKVEKKLLNVIFVINNILVQLVSGFIKMDNMWKKIIFV